MRPESVRPVPPRRRLPAAAPAAALLLALGLAPAALADHAAVGTWLTESGNAKVRIDHCADIPAASGFSAEELCGEIVWLEDPDNETGQPHTDRNNPDQALRDRPIMGLPILTGFDAGDAPNVWDDGQIYNPEDGETYESVMSLKDGGDRLEVRGYVGLPIFGQSQVWSRSR